MQNLSVFVAAVLVVGLASMAPVALAQDYSGNAKCKMCHSKAEDGEAWVKWSNSKHKKALETLKTPEAIAIGKEKGLPNPPAESPECLKCHVTGYDVAAKAVPANITLEDGVQCESCHGQVSAAHQAWGMKAKLGKAEEGADKGVRKGAEEDCLKCHNQESPTWNPEKYTNEKGEKVGFDFKKAYELINHSKPE